MEKEIFQHVLKKLILFVKLIEQKQLTIWLSHLRTIIAANST